ncbi:hypothetical protein Pfo_016680 [Paulownia fortunei]|nr:hypothetical protein Pfo_016680 [Paulownia fortunei]
MEEREKSLSDEKDCPLFNETNRHGNDDIRSSPPKETTKANSPTEDDPLPESSQPTFHSGTYVVQVPKDQIYRVPPPENAFMLEERNRKQNKQKRSSCCFGCCHSCIFMLFRGNKSG